MTKGNSVSASMIFKTLERYSVMGVQLIVQIVIARILSPEDYGVVAMMSVFIAIATVFIQNGFSMAIVQKKEADERDYGTALLINLLIGVFLYIIIFIAAPYISVFYHQPEITPCIRTLALILIIGSVNSIQVAISNRQMQFKNLFKCNLIASIVSGIIGVVCALIGLGYWALVIQQLSSSALLLVLITLQQHWVPRFCFKKDGAASMFSFGWKTLCASLLNEIFNQINSLIIGRKYSSSDLAFYTKGNQFPKYVTMGVDTSISTVMFSAFSNKQDEEKALHNLMRKTICINSYIVIPLLTFLAVSASNIIVLLLTEKWLPVVPFMQLACITCAFHPVAAAQVQLISAIGRSDLRLIMEIIKKIIFLGLLIPAVQFGPIAIAISGVIAGVIGVLIGAIYCQKYVNYRITVTLSNLFPIIIASCLMGGIMALIGCIDIHPVFIMCLQVILGGFVFFFVSKLLNIYGFSYLKDYIIKFINK